MIEIKMPQLGQTTDEVRIVRWLVKEGQEVKRGEPLCEVETDKVVMELESVESGTVSKIISEPDSQVKTGEVVALIEPPVKKTTPSADVEKPDSSSGIETSVIEKGNLTGTIQTTSISEKDIIEKDATISHETYFDKANHHTTIKVHTLNLTERKNILTEIGKDKAIGMLQRMIEIREFEERIRLLFLEGKMPGTIHQYIGQEACAVGVCWALEKDDVMASTHRPHGHAIARGIPMDAIMAELYGKTTGCCKGKGGSMHIGDLSKGMLPAIAIVGGNIPIVGGMALAFKLRNEPRVAVSFFGDGASNEGAFHESLNMAQIYKVPAVFVCENNLYGASTSIKLTAKVENIADRACAYGMRSDIGDGMDVLDVYRRTKNAAEFARSSKGPTLLELKTFRFCGHSRRDPNNYMTKEEREYWKLRDPIILFENLLLTEGILDDKEILNLRKEVDTIIDKAVEFGQTGPNPEPEDTYKDLYVTMEVPR